jgi:hypothetical protein
MQVVGSGNATGVDRYIVLEANRFVNCMKEELSTVQLHLPSFAIGGKHGDIP